MDFIADVWPFVATPAPSETSGFIGVQAIRLKKYGAMKAEKGEVL